MNTDLQKDLVLLLESACLLAAEVESDLKANGTYSMQTIEALSDFKDLTGKLSNMLDLLNGVQ